MAEFVRKWGPLVTPTVIILGASYKSVPLFGFLLVVAFLGTSVLYHRVVWPHKLWPRSKDKKRERFRRLIIALHIGLSAGFFVIPIGAMVAYLAIDGFPEWLDSVVSDTLEQPGNLRRLERETLRIGKVAATISATSRSHIGIIRETEGYFVPTRVATRIATMYLSVTVTHIISILFLFVLVGISGKVFGEFVGDIVSTQESKRRGRS